LDFFGTQGHFDAWTNILREITRAWVDVLDELFAELDQFALLFCCHLAVSSWAFAGLAAGKCFCLLIQLLRVCVKLIPQIQLLLSLVVRVALLYNEDLLSPSQNPVSYIQIGTIPDDTRRCL
jgi:hypothetical protein